MGGQLHVTHVSEAPSREVYESLREKVGLLDDQPTGLIVHTAGETPTGTVQIINVCESRADADACERDRLLPVFEAAGLIERGPIRAICDEYPSQRRGRQFTICVWEFGELLPG
jgi:hypothetical protein